MTRRSDRALPPLHTSRRWLLSIPLFLSILTVSTLSIFNYQKSSSPIVASAMYALRTNARAREYLGDEVTFKDRVPWIWGEMNQLHGRIDVQWGVKGGREKGWVRFKSERRGRMGKFTTQEWSLETSDGRIIDLLEENGGVDPFQQPATTPVEATHEGGRTVL
ncbi:MAG: hypothetical protein M1817_006111 [Caeruleum heppii]|nr:MAG: hypothetical protein M1817_006111 [Caeruleum heppii]